MHLTLRALLVREEIRTRRSESHERISQRHPTLCSLATHPYTSQSTTPWPLIPRAAATTALQSSLNHVRVTVSSVLTLTADNTHDGTSSSPEHSEDESPIVTEADESELRTLEQQTIYPHNDKMKTAFSEQDTALSAEERAKTFKSAIPKSRHPRHSRRHASSAPISLETNSALGAWATWARDETTKSLKKAWEYNWDPLRTHLGATAAWMKDAATVAGCVVATLAATRSIAETLAGKKDDDDEGKVVINLFGADALGLGAGSPTFFAPSLGAKSGDAASGWEQLSKNGRLLTMG